MVEYPLQDELAIAAFIASIWLMEKFMEAVVKGSPLLGQIVVGIIFGPALLDIIPDSDAYRLLGKLGVMILVIDSGLRIKLREVREVGVRAILSAFTGVLFPVLLSLLVLTVCWGESFKAGLAAGAAIAPTSLGFSAKLLAEVGKLESRSGKLICVAAVVDDVMSLVLLAEIQAFRESNATWWDIASPFLGSCLSIIVGLVFAIYLPPHIMTLRNFLRRLLFGGGSVDNNADDPQAPPTQDSVLLMILFGYAAGMAWISALLKSSDLLGCFFAGMAFSEAKGFDRVWDSQCKRIGRWGASLFFAASIGFGVPSLLSGGGLFEPESIAKGGALFVAAVVGKLMLGVWSQPLTLHEFSKFGWAMNGRGEFSFLIADQAAEDDILDDTNYSAVIWALLLSSLLAPFAFRRVLRSEQDTDMGIEKRDADSQPPEPVMDKDRGEVIHDDEGCEESDPPAGVVNNVV